jgi:hypothetical protein
MTAALLVAPFPPVFEGSPATVNLASGLAVGIQVITKDPASGAFDSSNTEIINVP